MEYLRRDGRLWRKKCLTHFRDNWTWKFENLRENFFTVFSYVVIGTVSTYLTVSANVSIQRLIALSLTVERIECNLNFLQKCLTTTKLTKFQSSNFKNTGLQLSFEWLTKKNRLFVFFFWKVEKLPFIRPPTRDLHLNLDLELNKTTKYNRVEEFSKPVHKTSAR